MILSDHSIKAEISAGRIVVDPYDESLVQPSSIDVRLDRFFRVFLNHTMGVIDVKENLEELTQLVEISDEDTPFILHPGEFVLGATLERIALPNDMVARIEGKSSLGRLGLLIHSSLPGFEEVLFRDATGLRWRRVDEIVGKQLDGDVVAFDPTTFEVGYHRLTGWYEGPADRIFEVRLASGRSVHVTAGHNLFTLDRDGAIAKVRTGALRPGARIAIADPTTETTTIGSRCPEHELLTSVPLPDRLLAELRESAGCRAASDLEDIEPSAGCTAVCTRTLGRLREAYAAADPELLARLDRIIDGDLLWDEVLAVTDTGRTEPIYDLEVRPDGRKIENFLAGRGGVLVSNTAGFIDPGFDGHITLELSNVANLPITLYPHMKIGQISFHRMDSPADVPYGSGSLGSKYQGQRGPTPSRYWENFPK